jgi:hypothetical protein
VTVSQGASGLALCDAAVLRHKAMSSLFGGIPGVVRAGWFLHSSTREDVVQLGKVSRPLSRSETGKPVPTGFEARRQSCLGTAQLAAICVIGNGNAWRMDHRPLTAQQSEAPPGHTCYGRTPWRLAQIRQGPTAPRRQSPSTGMNCAR